MASVNRVFIQGVLGHTPQAHTSRKDGRRYATLNIATTRWVVGEELQTNATKTKENTN